MIFVRKSIAFLPVGNPLPTKSMLMQDTVSHIQDVAEGLAFFASRLTAAAAAHDIDKLTDIDQFYSDFRNRFKDSVWWENHKRLNRHHLGVPDGVPPDVDLIDVLEMISDCVMAGSARNDGVPKVVIDADVLMKAFENTVARLIAEVMVTG